MGPLSRAEQAPVRPALAEAGASSATTASTAALALPPPPLRPRAPPPPAALQEADRAAPNNGPGLFRHGIALERAGRRADAIAVYQRAIKADGCVASI